MLVLSTHVARQTSVGISKMHCKHSDVMPCYDMSWAISQGRSNLLPLSVAKAQLICC